MSLSVLRRSLPRLSTPRRPCLAAYLSTEPPPTSSTLPEAATPSAPASIYGDDPAFFDSFSTKTLSSAPGQPSPLDEPPVGPSTAYPAQGPNPLAQVREQTTAEILRAKPTYTIYVKATRTNTIVTLTRPNRTVLLTLTGGKVGFKGTNRSGYEAGYRCATGVFKRLEEELKLQDLKWELYLNGFGQGREAAQKALMAGEGQGIKHNLIRITDKTPIKVGGTRAQKMKRR